MKKQKQILLFAGKKRSGKDYLADMFIDRINASFVKVSFARKLKQVLSEITLLSVIEFDKVKNDDSTFVINKDTFVKNWKLSVLKLSDTESALLNTNKQRVIEIADGLNIFDTVKIISQNGNTVELNARNVIQNVGESFKTIFENRDIWAILLAKDLLKISKNFIISDFRYPEEYNVLTMLLKSYEVTTVKIIGKNFHNELSEEDFHISETALDNIKFNYYLNNTIHDWTSVYEQLNALNNEILK